jgi:hypothetical protein
MPAVLAPHPSLSPPVVLGSYTPSAGKAGKTVFQANAASSSRLSHAAVGEVVKLGSGSVRRARGLIVTVAAGASVTLTDVSAKRQSNLARRRGPLTIVAHCPLPLTGCNTYCCTEFCSFQCRTALHSAFGHFAISWQGQHAQAHLPRRHCSRWLRLRGLGVERGGQGEQPLNSNRSESRADNCSVERHDLFSASTFLGRGPTATQQRKLQRLEQLSC